MAQRYSHEVAVNGTGVVLRAIESRESLAITFWKTESTVSRPKFVGELKLVSSELALLQSTINELLRQSEPRIPDRVIDGYERLLRQVAPGSQRKSEPRTQSQPSEIAAVLGDGEVWPARLDLIRRRYPSAYSQWTPDEEQQLLSEFDAGVPIAEIAQSLGRQPGGIRSRLAKLGRIQ